MKLLNIFLISIVLGSLLIELNAIKRITKKKSNTKSEGCLAPEATKDGACALKEKVLVISSIGEKKADDKLGVDMMKKGKVGNRNCLKANEYMSDGEKGKEATKACVKMNRFGGEFSYLNGALNPGKDNYLNSGKFDGTVKLSGDEYIYDHATKTKAGFIVATNAPIGDYKATKKLYGDNSVAGKPATTKPLYECPKPEEVWSSNWLKVVKKDKSGKTEVDADGDELKEMKDNKKDNGKDMECYSGHDKKPENTILAFYQNLAKHKITNVVMLTNFVERQVQKEAECKCKVKADQYWDKDAGKTFTILTADGKSSGATVKTTKVLSVEKSGLPLTEIRTLEFTDKGSKKPYTVTHYHFKGWMDFAVPKLSDIKPLVDKIAKEKADKVPKNTIVHCTGGIGRTGTFIGSVLSHGLDKTKKINIARFILSLRKIRPEAIEAASQVNLLATMINKNAK